MAKKNLSGLMAMITGGAGGIGLEFAKNLAALRASVIIIDIDDHRLSVAKKEIEDFAISKEYIPRVLTLKADLTDEDVVAIIDNFCSRNDCHPDILINNAGIFSFKPIADTDAGKIETFINLHIRAVTVLSRWFVALRKPKASGWMLNMSSMSCWMPMPGLAMYASTKSYIRVFSRSLHYEMKDYGVGVTVACPGGISTNLFGLPDKWKKFAVAIGVLQTPQDFTRKAIRKMLDKKPQYINGFLNRFSIFFVGILPTGVRMMVKRRLLDRGITR